MTWSTKFKQTEGGLEVPKPVSQRQREDSRHQNRARARFWCLESSLCLCETGFGTSSPPSVCLNLVLQVMNLIDGASSPLSWFLSLHPMWVQFKLGNNYLSHDKQMFRLNV